MKFNKVFIVSFVSYMVFFVVWRFIMPYLYDQEPTAFGGYNGIASIYAFGNTAAFIIARWFVAKKGTLKKH